MTASIEKVGRRKAKFEDALTITGYGKFNIIVLLATGGCLMMVIVETMAMMFIVPASQCDLDLSLTTKGIMSAISFLGVVSSSYLWGFIADTKGRRNVMIISMAASFVTSVSSSIIPQAWLFILVRYINGFFVGGASAIVYAYLGEFHDNKYRPKAVSWLATFVAFGNMYIPGLAWAILPLHFSYDIPFLDITFRPWRLLVICYGIPSLFFSLWLLRLPESPKYLVAQGKYDEALEILKDMYAMNSGKSREDYPIDELEYDQIVNFGNDKKKGIFRTMWNQTAPLFKSPYLGKTFMVSLLQFGAFASSSGLLMWYPEILNRMAAFTAENPTSSISLCDSIEYYNGKLNLVTSNTTMEPNICLDHVDPNVFQTSLLIGATFAVMYIFIGTVINAIGAKNLLVIFLAITTACGLGAQYITNRLGAETLMGIFLTEATCVGIINAIVVDLFPTQLRAMALALSLMAGRFGAVVGSNVSGPLIYNFCDYTFYVYAADHIILIITVFLLASPKRSISTTSTKHNASRNEVIA